MSNEFIPQDIPFVCEGRCGMRITPHSRVVYKDPPEDRLTCKVCGQRTVIKYTQREAVAQSNSGITPDAERARRAILATTLDLQARRWSKGMGQKDRNFITRIVQQLLKIARILDTDE